MAKEISIHDTQYEYNPTIHCPTQYSIPAMKTI